MPYTRFAAIIFVCILLILAFMGPRDNTWFSYESLWISVWLAVFVLFISLMQNLFLDIVVLFSMSFFMQRIVMLYFFPDTFVYTQTIKLYPEVFILALWFIFACLCAIWIGYLLFKIVRLTNKQKKDVVKPDNANILGKGALFSRFFSFYAIICILFFILRLVLEMVFKVGITGIIFERYFAVWSRIGALMGGLGFIAFITLLKNNSKSKDRKLAILLIILQVLQGVLLTSKAALLAIIVSFMVCIYFIRGYIPVKYVKYPIIIFILTALVYSPLIMIVRSEKIAAVETGKGFDSSEIKKFVNSKEFAKPDCSFLARLGGLDWLLGFMAVGRDKFPSYVSLKGDMVEIINTLVPGDIIDTSTQISIRHLIPIILRGYSADSISSWGGHGEVLGIVGMAYVYFGLLGGPLFFLIWSFISLMVIHSRLSVVVKILYFQCFVIEIMLGGYLVIGIKQFYESILMIGLIFILAKTIPRFKFIKNRTKLEQLYN